jgi:5-methylthioadenosine/S-adenosylhomocysteine deaminase
MRPAAPERGGCEVRTVAVGASLKIENARFVVTMDAERRILRDGSLLIEGGRIARVGKAAELAGVPAERTIDAREMVATPGLVNTHLHISYAHAVRGLWPDDLPMAQFTPAVYTLMGAMTEAEEHDTTLLALTELVKYGTTTVLDPGSTKFLDACLPAYERIGCRAVVGRLVIDKPLPFPLPVSTTADALATTERVIRAYDGRLGGRIRAWAMPNSCEGATDELLLGLKRLADEHGVGLTMHQGNSDPVVADYLERLGVRPVLHLERLGVLGPNVLLSLAVGIDDAEVAALARTGTAVSIEPSGNVKFGLGTTRRARFPEMVRAGVTMSVGTDSANASNLVDTTRAMYLAAVLYKDAREDKSMIPAEAALEMATIGGARALGLEREIGSLEPGKKADLVLWDTRRPEWRNLFNPVQQLVYSADGRSVHTVICDGRVLVEGYRMRTVDEGAVIDRAQAMGERLLARTGIEMPARWPIA